MRYALALFSLLLSAKALSSPAEERPESNIPILDTAQHIFGARANFAANRLDSFFATERADDELGRSSIRIRSQFILREREKSDQENQYRINLRLPHLEEKFKYEYYQDDDDRKRTEAERRKKAETNRLRHGWIFNIDMGVSAAIPPKLITRARVRNTFVTGTLIHRFAEQLTYTTDESGLVEETSIDSDHVFSENVVFRFINYKQWEVLQKDFRTNHGPTLLHQVSEDEAFNYSATTQSIIEDGIWFVNNYRFSVNYRRNLYKQWIYLDTIPGIDFPKKWSFRRTPFIVFQLELLFGG